MNRTLYPEQTETNEIIITRGRTVETKDHCSDSEGRLGADEWPSVQRGSLRSDRKSRLKIDPPKISRLPPDGGLQDRS